VVLTSSEHTVEAAIMRQRDRALEQGVTLHVVDEAVRATRNALAHATGGECWIRSRAEGYFWTVVRRTLVRRRTDKHVTARFVLAAVVEDLTASGRDNAAVWAEIERGWSDSVPCAVLEEYRLRLSA